MTHADIRPAPTAPRPLPARPRIHFTPQKNWINDPNGLVWFEGEYHLFYQYNPFGRGWGHMSWGHAVSSDLLHWTELDVAIPETDVMAFSGSALVDWNNTSGLGDGANPPILAFLTVYDAVANRQKQALAYSHDRGRTFAMYAGNPIIDLDMENHRDPNVFRHEPSGAWVMVVALSQLHQVEIYRSTDLLNWTLASTFGPAGSRAGQWECPALIEVPDQEDPTITRWVLKIDVDKDLVEGGSGAQYFIGDFDGHAFIADANEDGPIAQLADYGRDFYAAINWCDLPPVHDHPVWLGWMSNHQTGKDYPTDPWVGAMTIPRELFVHKSDGLWSLGQRPVGAVAATESGDGKEWTSLAPQKRSILAEIAHGGAWWGALKTRGEAPGGAIVRLSDGVGAALVVDWDPESRTIRVRQDGKVYTAPAGPSQDALDLQLVIDANSLELFIDGGKAVTTFCLFPSDALSLVLEAKSAPLDFVFTGSPLD